VEDRRAGEIRRNRTGEIEQEGRRSGELLVVSQVASLTVTGR
jgi:hypothetical protein